MSLYSQYVKERENGEVLEVDGGFASYRINGKECYIVDVYVVPEQRKTGLASKLGDQIAEIAKSKGCTYLLGTVAPQAVNSTISMKFLLAYGFKLAKSDNQLIYFIKEL